MSMARPNMLVAGTAFALMMLCGGIVSASAAQISAGRHLLQGVEEFPPLCDCDRDPDHSPYSLIPLAPQADGGYNKYCFDLRANIKCSPTAKCCNGKQGVEKVEFDVADTCKDSLKKVTVNGEGKSFEYNTKLDVLRITNLDLTPAAADRTQICLFIKKDSTTCSELSTLCGLGNGGCKYAIFNQDRDCCPVRVTGAAPPPPPFEPGVRKPPPPPPTFPFCNCVSDPAQSRLTTIRAPFVTSGNLTKACFTVKTKDSASCPATSKCCAFTLYKLELESNPDCKDSLVYTTVNGSRRVRFFQSNPHPAIKVTNINKSFSSVDGTEVCLFLRGTCTTPATLCPGGKCTVSLFNKPGSSPSCCPTVDI